MKNKKPDSIGLVKETVILTVAVAIIVCFQILIP